jgi:5'-nucleotidase/UDP-sugar diphosphatase
MKTRQVWRSAVILGCLTLMGCAHTGVTEQEPLAVRILHINDHHSHLQATQGTLTLNGEVTAVEIGGFPRVVATIEERAAATSDPVLKLHAGDAITGDLYYTLFRGAADAALMNHACFDAFALGNHEFDDGDAGLARFLDHLKTGGCGTDVVAANVNPQVGVSPLTAQSATDYIRPYVIKELSGERVGIIGIVIRGKTLASSSPDPGTDILDETATAQRYIDELTARGINKIILLTHQGYANDQTLARKLRGVDVIIGGDSHTLLGDALSDVGLQPAGPYPTRTTDRDGNLVCIAQAWQYALVVGELDVRFDARGRVTDCDGTPYLPLGDTFRRGGAELIGDARAEVLQIVEAMPELTIVPPDPAADATLAQYSEQVDALKHTPIGTAPENLCYERIPGQGESIICDTSDTSANGADISNLVALAFRNQSLRADIGLVNAGGVRMDLAAGEITIGSAYQLLPFASTLVNLEMTGAEILAALEDAAAYALDPSGSTGAYPYASGLRWDVDLSAPAGQRFSNVEVKPKAQHEWLPLDPEQMYVVVTIDYLAGGRDGYQRFGPIYADETRAEPTYLDYAQAFVDYVKSVEMVSKLPRSEYSTQNFTGVTN